MQIYQIKRKNIIHCGIKVRSGNELITVSVCSGRWDCVDVVSKGESAEVTCKRCQKILATADENGVVTLTKKKR